MKKLLLIIFLFFCCINVFAADKKFVGSEFLEGISYMKYDGNTHYYRNAQVIRNADTNQIAYCVEPFSLLIDNTSYTSSSSYSSKFGISKELWKKIKLYAFYGYGYKGHTDKKWISITQLSIWREMYPDYQFEWIDNTTSRNIIKPYNSEIKELKNLVKAHYDQPSIEKNITAPINSTLVLEDTNKVLERYKVKSSDFVLKKKNNTLTIETGENVKNGKIIFEIDQKNNSNPAIYFYSESSQNLMEKGSIDTLTIEMEINTYNGQVEIKKIDGETIDTPQGEATLDGAIFDLYDSDMNYLSSKEVENGIAIFDSLTFGKYYVQEKQSGNGYYLNKNTYEFEISKDNTNPTLEIENYVIKSKIKLIKYYGTREDYKNNNMKKEKDVTFNVYDKDENIIFIGKTNKDGILEFSLPYGIYTVKQIDSKNGYQINDDFIIEVNDESNYSIEIPLYDFKIKVFNASISLIDYLEMVVKELW